MGVDSTAVLVEFERRGIVPDLIIFADTGSEADHTYAFRPIIDAWLKKVGFPPITEVKYQAKDFKHWPPYSSLEENCLTNTTLPSLAYGGKSCSQKWKISPQEKFCNQWDVAIQAWALGMKVRKVIGYDYGTRDQERSNHIGDINDPKYDYWYPLQDWKWDRDECKTQIAASSLPYVPEKSSCYFCPSMKPHELHSLTKDKLSRIVMIEARTAQRHIDGANERRAILSQEIETGLRWTKATKKKAAKSSKLSADEIVEVSKKLKGMGAHNTPIIEGLWRRPVKGFRLKKDGTKVPNGATPKPGSMTQYIREKGLLAMDYIDKIIRETPIIPLSAEDISTWQDLIDNITSEVPTTGCEACSCATPTCN
jgi:hypothetical protein